jgi:hypothetical protein
MKRILDHNDEKLLETVRSGRMSLSAAVRLIADIQPYNPTHRQPVISDDPIVSCVHGENSDLIAQVARLYLRTGMTIADVTFARGMFWQAVDVAPFDFLPSDISPQGKGVRKMDFRKLDYADESIDVAVFDPPYLSRSGTNSVYARRYQTHLAGKSYSEMLALYVAGMKECRRVVKTGGLLWVKCADEIQTSKFKAAHCDILDAARGMGFEAVDLFVLMRTASGMLSSPAQRHSRRNHSYLWIFEKGQNSR